MGIISRFIKSKVKGFTGEAKTDILLSFLDNSKYKIINNFMTKINGKSCQIDHLIISQYGLFVVETKNRSGWIFAGEHNDYWTQVNYKIKTKFYNPLRQNNGHINVLKHYLKEFSDIKYVPIIVFSSAVEFKTEVPSNVIYYHELVGMIKSFSVSTITEVATNEIFEKLLQINGQYDHSNSNHVRNVKKTIEDKERNIASGLCLRCGGNLVMRNGKYGNFYGCSNYPKCKYTHKA
ncbi:MAG: hypothetical protein Ta2A_13180 [Treponemataceae bacterium]|nr:MAG: hypothetical protein Ta2A_13180 [Treponemataceae bacterium]